MDVTLLGMVPILCQLLVGTVLNEQVSLTMVMARPKAAPRELVSRPTRLAGLPQMEEAALILMCLLLLILP